MVRSGYHGLCLGLSGQNTMELSLPPSLHHLSPHLPELHLPTLTPKLLLPTWAGRQNIQWGGAQRLFPHRGWTGPRSVSFIPALPSLESFSSLSALMHIVGDTHLQGLTGPLGVLLWCSAWQSSMPGFKCHPILAHPGKFNRVTKEQRVKRLGGCRRHEGFGDQETICSGWGGDKAGGWRGKLGPEHEGASRPWEEVGLDPKNYRELLNDRVKQRGLAWPIMSHFIDEKKERQRADMTSSVSIWIYIPTPWRPFCPVFCLSLPLPSVRKPQATKMLWRPRTKGFPLGSYRTSLTSSLCASFPKSSWVCSSPARCPSCVTLDSRLPSLSLGFLCIKIGIVSTWRMHVACLVHGKPWINSGCYYLKTEVLHPIFTLFWMPQLINESTNILKANVFV